jgi:ABC-2 type transport system ATP-binding protein
VTVFGHDVVRDCRQVRSRMGFMPDRLNMYRQMTVFEYLDFFAAAYGLGYGDRTRILNDVLALTDMAGRRDAFLKSLSRGMQQRVGLARVLVHDPQLLLLDEPASGLDPRARIELMEILRELRRMGKTIFISSHILTELADLCDSFTIIDRGRIKFSGAARDLLAHGPGQAVYTLALAEEHPPVEEALGGLPGVVAVSRKEEEIAYALTIDPGQTDPNAVLRAVMDSGARVRSFREDMRHLNEAFMDLTEPGVPS